MRVKNIAVLQRFEEISDADFFFVSRNIFLQTNEMRNAGFDVFIQDGWMWFESDTYIHTYVARKIGYVKIQDANPRFILTSS